MLSPPIGTIDIEPPQARALQRFINTGLLEYDDEYDELTKKEIYSAVGRQCFETTGNKKFIKLPDGVIWDKNKQELEFTNKDAFYNWVEIYHEVETDEGTIQTQRQILLRRRRQTTPQQPSITFTPPASKQPERTQDLRQPEASSSRLPIQHRHG